jgi:hypothetical protein
MTPVIVPLVKGGDKEDFVNRFYHSTNVIKYNFHYCFMGRNPSRLSP